MKVIRTRPGKYKIPKFWTHLESLVPDIRPLFLNDTVLRTKVLREFIKNLPLQCPFSKAYELELSEFGHRVLIYFVPPLCKLNPLYNWIIDLKVEIFESDRKISELTKLKALPTHPRIPVKVPLS